VRRAAIVAPGLFIGIVMLLAAGSLRAECIDYGECGYCVPGVNVPSTDVAVIGTYACVVGSTGLTTFDVSDPASPHQVGSLSGDYGALPRSRYPEAWPTCSMTVPGAVALS
jgi:hypothetical protein